MYIKVRVRTQAKKESIKQIKEGVFAVSVTEKPELNRANMRVLILCAEYCNVPLSHIRIISGHHGPHKMLEIKEFHA